MTSTSPAPKLSLWAFVATDVLLVAGGIFIATHSKYPLTETEILAIVGCFVVGAVVGLVPAIVHYERQKNEMLDDRQRALEALARTLTSSAEQISIAASGLHEIADVAQKNLRHAEQLPHKLQEKIAEFQAQLANANETEREELKKELEDLRSSESERLQAVSDKIAKTAAELGKLEATTQQHLTGATDALAKLNFGTASAIGKAQAAAEQAMAQARQEAARIVAEAATAAVKSIEAAKASAVADIAAQFDAGTGRLKEAAARLEAAADKLPSTPPPAIGYTITPPEPAPEVPPTHPTPEPQSAEPTKEGTPTHEPPATPPKRPRKPRREEPAPTHAATPEPEVATAPTVPTTAVETPVEAAPESASSAEPAPVRAEQIAEVAPVAPETAEPFPTLESKPAAEAAEPAKPARKRAAPKPEDDQPGLGLEIETTKTDGEGAPGTVERVLTSDGATRLLVTAYIGIGNRLFIRGTGPGLSWDKGVPLQFVSIGKWRWETNEASGPVQFKLLKNDEQECAGLGTLTIDPGHQHEVTASFN